VRGASPRGAVAAAGNARGLVEDAELLSGSGPARPCSYSLAGARGRRSRQGPASWPPLAAMPVKGEGAGAGRAECSSGTR